MNRKLRKIELAVLCALLIAFVAGNVSFLAGCKNVRDNVLRLHVIANSDSNADQSLKLQVRDAVLSQGAELFDGSVGRDDAAAKITPSIPRLEAAAQDVIDQNGRAYRAKVTIGEEYFPTRSYGGVTIPAGKYMAVKVTLGGGEGQNWWCIMFPPLCLPAAQDSVSIDAFLDGDGVKVVNSDPKYEFRFKAVEIIEKIKAKFF